LTVAQVAEIVKTSSSKWIKTKGTEFSQFHWQGGYGAFSVSESVADAVVHYISIRRNTTGGGPFRRNSAISWNVTMWPTMNAMSGIDSPYYVALTGLHSRLSYQRPGPMGRAEEFSAFGAVETAPTPA
jgi:hypothetical protein